MTLAKVNTGTRRINRGRGHSYELDGQKTLGVTTILKEGIPKPALINWAAERVAEFVVARRQLIEQLDDRELFDLASRAPYRERDLAKDRGVEIHKLASKLADGDEVDVPEELLGHVESYLGFLEDLQLTEGLVERPCFNRQWLYGGTFDLIAKTDRLGLGMCLFDLKSGGKGIFGEVALQMAGYGHAEFYLDDALQEQPMPTIENYVAVWVRGDGYDAYLVDVTEQEWVAFKSAARVAWWAMNRQRVVVGNSLWSRMRLEEQESA